MVYESGETPYKIITKIEGEMMGRRTKWKPPEGFEVGEYFPTKTWASLWTKRGRPVHKVVKVKKVKCASLFKIR